MDLGMQSFLNNDCLYILTITGGNAQVPYLPYMPVHAYLRYVLAPILQCYTEDNGNTVLESFIYNRPDGIKIVFNSHANRLNRVDELIAPGETLHRVFTWMSCDSSKFHELRGNASPE